jgi:hypothetical protein
LGTLLSSLLCGFLLSAVCCLLSALQISTQAFDINALPIKVGRLRLTFDPPLWRPGRNGSSSGGGNRSWSQTLWPANGSITIRTGGGSSGSSSAVGGGGGGGGYDVTILIDANAPVLRVHARHSSAQFTLKAAGRL